VRWIGKQLVVHPQTATAPALAICAATKQRRFAAMDRLLWEEGFKARQFDKTGCWDEIDGCPVVASFARKIGLDSKRFRDDMKGDCLTWLRNNEAAIKQLGGAATPTFFINGRHISGAQPADAFATLIDEELAKAKARVQQGTPRATYYDKWIVDEGEPDLDQ
jgi:predicted DsbA family dithiol-disulfide isomerase